MILNQETMKPKLAKKTKYMRKTAKHSVRQPKLKDAKVQQKIKKLGKHEDPNTRYWNLPHEKQNWQRDYANYLGFGRRSRSV